jgi:hypothetical protein
MNERINQKLTISSWLIKYFFVIFTKNGTFKINCLEIWRLKKQILLYATNEVRDAVLFEEALTSSLAGLNIERYASIESLTDRLIHVNGTKIMAVIYAASEKDLIDLYFMQHVLRRVEVVLLLPDTERHTIAMGHRLNPCYMCTNNTDTSHLMEVVKNIAVNGTVPQPSEKFRNPFESLMPITSAEFHSHMTEAA